MLPRRRPPIREHPVRVRRVVSWRRAVGTRLRSKRRRGCRLGRWPRHRQRPPATACQRRAVHTMPAFAPTRAPAPGSGRGSRPPPRSAGFAPRWSSVGGAGRAAAEGRPAGPLVVGRLPRCTWPRWSTHRTGKQRHRAGRKSRPPCVGCLARYTGGSAVRPRCRGRRPRRLSSTETGRGRARRPRERSGPSTVAGNARRSASPSGDSEPVESDGCTEAGARR